jgi:exonuclease III
MDYWKRSSEQRELGWNYLVDSINPEIALLQEVVPPEKHFETHSILYHEIDKKRKWGTSIIAKHKIVKEIYLNNTYPGSTGLIVAEIKIADNFILTVINIYGLIDSDGYASTTLHHILSDLTPILHNNKKQNIVLGGDFNVSEQFDLVYKDQYPSHKLVFQRLEDFGLINCTKEIYKDHIQTHVHSRSTFEWQNDYIFVNKNVMEKVIDCKVVNNPEMLNFSDHYPVFIDVQI